MQLTTFTDFSIRLLLYAAANQERLITIEEASQVYKVSRGHLMKVANALTRAGFLKAVRGRSGGLMLARKPEDIRLGALVRVTEPDFALVECFATGSQCIVTKCCRMPDVLNEALRAFTDTLDRYTLQDVMLRPRDFVRPTPGLGPPRGPRFGPPVPH